MLTLGPTCYQDSGAPAVSYQSIFVNIVEGQLYVDNSTGNYYTCTNASNQAALVWELLPNQIQISSYQTQADWNQSNSSLPSYINNKPSIPAAPLYTQSNANGRSLNSIFQISATHNSLVSYSVDISCALTLTSGQTGTVTLQIASNSGFTNNVQTIATFINGNTGTLTLGLNLVQNVCGVLSGLVPAGYYCQLVTANTSGSPTFSYVGGQEVLL